jgi:hypothetical protein
MTLAHIIADLVAVIVEVQEITGYELSDGQEARFASGIRAVDKYIDPEL